MKLHEKKGVVFAIVLFLILISIFHIVRYKYFDSYVVGVEPYRYMLDNSSNNPYTFIINVLHEVTSVPIQTLSAFLPNILGLLCIILFFFFLQNTNLKVHQRIIFIIVLALSPAFVYSSLFSNPHIFALLLMILGFWFLLVRNRALNLVSGLIFAIIGLFSIVDVSVAIMALFAFYLSKRKRYILYVMLLCLLVFLLNYDVVIPINFDMGIIQGSFTDLGGLIGFGVFTVIFSVFGFVSSWKNKESLWQLYFFLLFLVAFLLTFGTVVNIYINIILTYFITLGISRLISRKWELWIIKYLTIIIMVCGFIFSAVSYTNIVSNLGPNPDVVTSLYWLRENVAEDSVVLAHYSRGFWINYFSERTPTLDSFSSKSNLAIMDELFQTRDLRKAQIILREFDVNYIWIDSEMRDGLIWTKEKQGLLFLFIDEDNFNKVYANNNVEIWEYIGG